MEEPIFFFKDRSLNGYILSVQGHASASLRYIFNFRTYLYGKMKDRYWE